jgi:hypothetical protein
MAKEHDSLQSNCICEIDFYINNYFHFDGKRKNDAYITLKSTQFRCILGKDLFRLGGGLRGTKQFPQMPEMQGWGPRSSI